MYDTRSAQMRCESGSVSMRTFSLKTKVGVVFPAVTVCVLAGILVLSQRIIESRIKAGISEQQYQIVSLLADDLDRQVVSSSETLVAIAREADARKDRHPPEGAGIPARAK